MFNIEDELKKLPKKPGVYIMRDKNDNIIYVGKAISLKNRVTQYFRKNNKTSRILKMVSLIDHFEYIVTDNESEALILECNLIKQNRPKFNVLLKDDKTYPYIKIDIKSDYPNVIYTRKILNDGAKYFGPYADAKSAKEMVSFIKERFKIRQCITFKSNKRACLNYHINKCSAPCMNYISKEDYKEQIKEIIMLLEGKTDTVLKKLDEQIQLTSGKLEYEKAAILRDKKLAIIGISEKQKVSNISENDIDVIGIARNDITVCVEIFFIRHSKMIDREHYFFDDFQELDNEEILSSFIKQYYIDKTRFPNKIMFRYEIEDKQILQELLSKKANRKVELRTPMKGEKLKLVEMAENNALITLNNKDFNKYDVIKELKEVLNLNVLPRKIESYDISNISGTNIVAGMCVAVDGVIKKNLSKKFKIKTVEGQNDVKCMEETVTRRLKHSVENSTGAFGKLPDLILADGGITQIKAIKKAVKEYKISIPVFGMVKDNKHKTRALIDEGRNEIKISQEAINFITELQNEVHRVAITYHKNLRDKELKKSELDNIKGIGETKKGELLRTFKSIDKIRQASIEELKKVKGINEELAKELKEKL